MPAVKTPFPSRVSAPDSGGRGTDHKIPTGGGGDGDWKPHRGRRGPRERLMRYRMGLGVMMVSSLMLFASVASAFFIRKDSFVFDQLTQGYINDWHPVAIPSLLWWNTLMLVLSSIALEFARRQYFREDVVMDEWLGLARPTIRRALPWEAISLVLASGFVIGQLVAWRELYQQGIFFGSSASSHFYFLLTALHGVHLLGGMVVLLWAILGTLVGRSIESRQITVDVTAWYWHAITLVWFGVFALLKYCQ
ncbi:MAG TPA: heme-copper oxidase subunit III [Terriglobales bacterium]|nr:heme-copper oxidase subunit III [Terriglobales bacterium]